MGSQKPDSPTKVILGELLYEFHSASRTETQAKIKKRLRYYKFGPYEQAKVDMLRAFKDSLKAEIGLFDGSRYYLGPHGDCAAMEDFDAPRIIADYHEAFPDVPLPDVEWFVSWAILTYYLR